MQLHGPFKKRTLHFDRKHIREFGGEFHVCVSWQSRNQLPGDLPAHRLELCQARSAEIGINDAPIRRVFGRIKSVGDSQVARSSIAEYVRTVENAHYILV